MLIAQLLNGLIIGCMYAVVAAGLTLVLGVLDRLNLAHTDVFAAGGFAGVLGVAMGGSVWWGLPIAFVGGGVIGLLVERVSFRGFRTFDGRVTAALSSIGFGMAIVDLLRKVWGGDPVGITTTGPLFQPAFQFGGVLFNWVQLIIVAASLLLCLGLHFLVTMTGFGRRVRAVAESPEKSSLLGIDVTAVAQMVFFVSSALAAVAGFLVALRSGSANADIGLTFGLKAIAIMAIGGMGDLRGALLAGLLVGVLEALMFEFNLGRLSEMLVWVLMIVFVLVRPGGLFGSGAHGKQERV